MDWTFADAVEAGVVADAAARAEVDLRGRRLAGQGPGDDRRLRRLRGGGRRAALALPAGRPVGRRRAAVAPVHLDGQQGDGSAHLLPDHVHRVGRHADQAGPAGRAALRLRAGEHPAHGRHAELAEHGGVLCRGGPVSHRQLPQPGARPGAMAGVDLQPGAGPGAAGGGPDLGPGDGRGRGAGPVSGGHQRRRPRGLPGGIHADALHRQEQLGAAVGRRRLCVCVRTPMPRAPSARRTARCHDPASCRRGGHQPAWSGPTTR